MRVPPYPITTSWTLPIANYEYVVYVEDNLGCLDRDTFIINPLDSVYIDSVIYTHHGPVSYDYTFKGNGEKEGYAMKWAGLIGGNNQRTLLDLNSAKNYEDYLKALEHWVAPAQNFVFASTEGDIALWIQGLFPNKWKGQGKFLMDGSNPENENFTTLRFGNVNNKDWYMFFNFTLTRKIVGGKQTCFQF